MFKYLIHQLAMVGSINPNPTQLLATAAQSLNEQTRSFGIRKRRARHDNHKQDAHRVDKHVAFSPVDLLSRIVPSFTVETNVKRLMYRVDASSRVGLALWWTRWLHDF